MSEKAKYRSASILLNVNTTIYLTFNVQLQFRYNKKLFNNCKFPYMFTLKIH
jgi:hypothetical protein